VKAAPHENRNDDWARSLFPKGYEGIFIEAGALNGVAGSATLPLEELGWEGLCVEPQHDQFEQLKLNRKCHVSKVCLAGQDHRGVEFFIPDDFPGRAGMTRTMPEHKRKKAGSGTTEVLTTWTLTRLLRSLKLDWPVIDFLNLDTEGSEPEIIRELIRTGRHVKAIAVEGAATHEMLIEAGYVETVNEYKPRSCDRYYFHGECGL
jgi:FkbM family methyltransferase